MTSVFFGPTAFGIVSLFVGTLRIAHGGSFRVPDSISANVSHSIPLQRSEYSCVSAEPPDSCEDPYNRWPNGVVPYTVKGFNEKERVKINVTIANLRSISCVDIRPRVSEQDYIAIVAYYPNCPSPTGRQGGKQMLYLGKDCRTEGEFLHILMHALGFPDEHNRHDRDNFVKIKYFNIEKSNWPKFEKSCRDTFGQPYDFSSVMHYGPYEFALDERKKSIVDMCCFEAADKMGQRNRLSRIDVIKLNKMYPCIPT